MIHINIRRDLTLRLFQSRQELKLVLYHLLAYLELSDCTVELQLTDDKSIAELNKSFLGLSGPTNILSFPAVDDDEEDSKFMGYISISLEAVFREVFLYGQIPFHHLIRLLAHGLLHLKGFEHTSSMEKITEDAVQVVSREFFDQFFEVV